MVSHCANPACGVPLRRLRNGRLFHFEMKAKEVKEKHSNHQAKNSHSVLHFWLCGKCSPKFTLNFDPANGVKIVPLYVARSVGSAR